MIKCYNFVYLHVLLTDVSLLLLLAWSPLSISFLLRVDLKYEEHEFNVRIKMAKDGEILKIRLKCYVKKYFGFKTYQQVSVVHSNLSPLDPFLQSRQIGHFQAE